MRTNIGRRFTGLVTGAPLAAGALFASAAPVRAYDPDPGVCTHYRDTDGCPCSGGTLTDPFDGTHVAHLAGGLAVRMELNDAGWFVDKVEFHPDDEKLWVYGTKNDGDTFYVAVGYSPGGSYHDLGTFSAPGTSDTRGPDGEGSRHPGRRVRGHHALRRLRPRRPHRRGPRHRRGGRLSRHVTRRWPHPRRRGCGHRPLCAFAYLRIRLRSTYCRMPPLR
ncbi:hypothetical protein [Streptomyces mutabilis]|uniref:hypothetical protein n=1 Tax=Streptomyces mutabilis TaxID=67332 RepID=UPI002795D838|nr:hypothetical protein [Streptomyces mutabilis]